MSETKTEQEPSMEEILASIRRIISEDGDGAVPKPEPTAADEGVLELTEVVDEQGRVNKLDIGEAPEPEPEPEPVPPPSPPPAGDSQLMSDTASAAAASALASLAALNQQQSTPAPPEPPTDEFGGKTVEQVTREVLRPLLKDWLDVNLPPLVERLVKQEIEKVVARMNRG